MTTDRIKILKDAIKWINWKGEKQRTKVFYWESTGDDFPKGTITVHAREYKHLPPELSPINNSDSQTDYFEEDRARITPKSRYYGQVLKAMQQKEESRNKREMKKQAIVQGSDPALMAKIKKLADVSEENSLLDYQLTGYLKDIEHKRIFGRMAKHKIRQKLKYSYVDRDTSGLYLVQTHGIDKGNVYGIKGYGRKGHHLGDIDKVIKQIEQSNQSLIQAAVKQIGLPSRKKSAFQNSLISLL